MAGYLKLLIEDGNKLLQENTYYILLEIQPRAFAKIITLTNTNKDYIFTSPTKFTLMEV